MSSDAAGLQTGGNIANLLQQQGAATAGGQIGQVPRAPQELCSWCLTGHGPTWTDLGTLRNTRWRRFNLRLQRRLSRWSGDEVTYKLDPPDPDVDTK